MGLHVPRFITAISYPSERLGEPADFRLNLNMQPLNPPTKDPERQKVRLPPLPVPTAPRMASLPWPCLDPRGAWHSVLVTGSGGPRPPSGVCVGPPPPTPGPGREAKAWCWWPCPHTGSPPEAPGQSFCPSPHSWISVSKCPSFPPGCEVAVASAVWWWFSETISPLPAPYLVRLWLDEFRI